MVIGIAGSFCGCDGETGLSIRATLSESEKVRLVYKQGLYMGYSYRCVQSCIYLPSDITLDVLRYRNCTEELLYSLY